MLRFRIGYENPKVLNGRASCLLDLDPSDFIYGGFPMVYYASKYLVRGKMIRYGINSYRVRNLKSALDYGKETKYWFASKKETLDFLRRPDVVKVNERSWANMPGVLDRLLPSNLIIRIND